MPEIEMKTSDIAVSVLVEQEVGEPFSIENKQKKQDIIMSGGFIKTQK